VLEQQGYEHTTIAHITARAGVSRRTFYELFTGREDCVAALIEDAVEQVKHELRDADLGGLSWRERVRRGLWVMLCFLDNDPVLAAALLVHTQRGSGRVLQLREVLIAGLVAAVEDGRRQNDRAADCSELTAEGVVGAALTILQSRLAHKPSRQLKGLHGELVGMIVLPYLGRAAARREQQRLAPTEPAPVCLPLAASDPLAELPMRITYRTARVLEGIGLQAGASNRQVADYAGIQDQGQVSKLLNRLERLGLVVNRGEGHARGEPNAWSLTSKGEQVVQSIGVRSTTSKPVAS
jgi:AcrR family transcriptional regulator/DNA-binding MarR family transcriptional regulator